MKKMMIVILSMLVLASLSFAQTYNSGSGLTGIDILGAHNNYGRGCAGCHAPHSGYFGAGGNVGTGTAHDSLTGTNALFAQDMGPLFNSQFVFGNGYTETTTDNITMYEKNTEEVRGILMCLACHDGSVAKGGMMKNALWETKLLPTGVYGSATIPTLLNNDGTTSGYGNDHPVGTAANWGALRLGSYLTATVDGTNGITGITIPSAKYQQFVNNYGMPAIAGTSWSWGFANPDGNTVANNLFITCTTCHNQHAMYVYKAPSGGVGGHTPNSTNGIQGGGYYPTYFFINSPYNVGAVTLGTDTTQQAPSTTQFCRQCHFGEANEAFGINNVTTKF